LRIWASVDGKRTGQPGLGVGDERGIMAEKHLAKSKTAGHELKQQVVVPFRGKTAADREQPPRTVALYRPFRFRLRNGFTGAVPMLERDATRIWRLVRQPEIFHPFAVFDSPTRRIGLNLHHTTCSQFGGHPGAGLLADAVPDTGTVDIVFSDSKEPLHIEVEPDALALSDGDYE